MKRFWQIAPLLLLMGWIFASCSTEYLKVQGVAYQSIRSATPIESEQIPQDATIIVRCSVGIDGEFDVIVRNNTDKIMTIDRTKSFFRNQSGNSIPYYDPTVTVKSQSIMVGGQTGASVNLGNVAAAAGIGGILGTALGGVNVGGSKENATTNTNTTYVIDQPQISIAPHGQVSMGRTFYMEGVGTKFLSTAVNSTAYDVNNMFTPASTYAACNLCVAYSIDEGNTYETILTDVYANSLLVNKVKQTGAINDALRNLYMNKANALDETWYLLYFESKAWKNNMKYKKSEILNYK